MLIMPPENYGKCMHISNIMQLIIKYFFIRLIVDMTSANCSHQVQQELSSTFARLCHLVDESTAEMKDNAKTMDRNIKELEEIAAKAKVLRNQATFLGNKLEMFESTYLQTE